MLKIFGRIYGKNFNKSSQGLILFAPVSYFCEIKKSKIGVRYLKNGFKPSKSHTG